ALRLSRCGERQADDDAVATLQLPAGIGYRRIGDRDRALTDQDLDAAARKVGPKRRGKPLVKPGAGGLAAGFEPQRATLRHSRAYYFRTLFAIRVTHRASGYCS